MDPGTMGIKSLDAHSPIPLPISSDSHHQKHSFRVGMWQKFHHFFGKDDHLQSPIHCPDSDLWPDNADPAFQRDYSDRRVGIGLPRQTTFRRQNSEKRERLLPIQPGLAERRAVSASRRVSLSVSRPRAKSSPPPANNTRTSEPALPVSSKVDESNQRLDDFNSTLQSGTPTENDTEIPSDENRPPRPPSRTSSTSSRYERLPGAHEKAQLLAELDTRWILNLSMHFRDKSDREKFFVTYAQTRNKWRRVTVSCDYRDAEPGSLEKDLKELQFQRDKSLQIYESIRDSLADIQFYDTVTNLKLETREGRLHVHVTEDVNEIIPYPSRTAVSHVLNDIKYQPRQVRENDLIFDSHISGFVYKVKYQEEFYVKKEIPGPDSVDEFLYEINALHSLNQSDHVIRLEAIVVDDSERVVKGLLISYAERGAVVDLLYDHRGAIPWEDRARWARHAVSGLSDIHQEGYVQGDLTLSNIVVDQKGNARIIDINRRGCPVGWEPPEIARKIASNQRISMYIGEKTDLYQLGMTLWALAMDDDEPERHDPPLSVEAFPSDVPEWYQDVVRICLSPQPRDRLSAKELIRLFPSDELATQGRLERRRPVLAVRTEKKYIDPSQAVERDDIERFSYDQSNDTAMYSPESSRDDYTFTYPRSSNYEMDSAESAFERPRGRRPPTNVAHLNPDETNQWSPGNTIPAADNRDDPLILTIHPSREPEYDELDLDGRSYLVPRNTFSEDELRILAQPNFEPSAFANRIRSDHQGLDQTLEAQPVNEPDFTYDKPSKPTSTNSESTPRNSHSLLPHLTPEQLIELQNGSHETDESDLGAPNNWGRDDLSNIQESPNVEHGAVPDSSFQPPRLAYVDSGFDEPRKLAEKLSANYVEEQEEELNSMEIKPQVNTGCAVENIPEREATETSINSDSHV